MTPSWVWLLAGREGIERRGDTVWLILRWQRDGKSAVMTEETAGMFVLEKFTR
jgi:hypothetical protein